VVDKLSSDELIRGHLSTSVPLLITGEKLPAALRKGWRRSSFRSRYGQVQLALELFPYAEASAPLYGQRFNRSTVGRITARDGPLWSCATSENPPLTIFSAMEGFSVPGSDAEQLGKLLSDEPATLAPRRDIEMPSSEPPARSAARLLADWHRPSCMRDDRLRSYSIQFFLGGRGSGAQPHWHSLSWNWLAHGRKRWVLWPPRDASYAQQHPALSVPLAINTSGEPLVCVQNAGDVLVVPENWGHATLNLEASIGWATEVRSERAFDLGLGDTLRHLL